MAEVFRADVIDAQGQQLSVALKLMKQSASPEAFADEADLMGLLNHPNLVDLIEFGWAFGRPYIAMKYLIGGDLRQVMSAHRQQGVALPVSLSLHIAMEVLKGLAYFHQAKSKTGSPLGLVHGDINPTNIFFSDEGDVKVGDFGVAKSHAVPIGPGEGMSAGKLHYLSPEQARGDALSPASDLFSLAVTLYELITGTLPFDAPGGDQAVLAAIRGAKLKLPPDIDKPLGTILKKALHSSPGSRFKSAGELGGALFQYALDQNLTRTREDLKAHLSSLLELVV
jgi:serine/threonine-protein kinase